MDITAAQAPDMIMEVLKAGLVPMLHSSPGMAKSSIYHQLAKEQELFVIDMRLSQSDPTDMGGFPYVNPETKKAGYMPMDTFPIEGDKIPEGYKGWLLLMDEFTSAPLAVQAAAYKVILDKQVGQFNLHPNVAIVAAGNLATDKAIVNRLSTAMQSRMIHFTLRIDNPAWLDWAFDNNIDHRIVSYIRYKPEILHNFNPNHNDMTFPCPRTWEFASKMVSKWPKIEDKHLAIIAGAIGEGAAREFYGYCDIYGQLPDISEMINRGSSLKIPDEPSTLYAISGYIPSHALVSNIGALMKYIERFPIEFQIITLSNILKKIPEIISETSVRSWIQINSQNLL